MISPSAYVHPHALVDVGAIVGAKTRVWAFAHVAAGAVVGDDCNICDQTFVESGVTLGNRVTVKCGVYLWDGTTVEDDVFIGPSAAFSNDLRPRSKRYPGEYMKTRLRRGCSIGANATLLPVTVGQYAMVGAGAVVTHDVPDFALVVGQPARQVAWVCECGEKICFPEGNTFAECTCGCCYEMGTAGEMKKLPS